MIESFPMSAWVSLGLRPLPAKQKCRGTEVSTWLAALQSKSPIHISQVVTHDELQALVAGLAGLRMEPGDREDFKVVGLPPIWSEDSWREGFIINPSARQ
jgi:hypothetical protein